MRTDNDIITTTAVADIMHGGAGNDTAVYTGAITAAKFLEQFFVFRSHRPDTAVLHFDSERRAGKITIFGAKVIAHYPINNESAPAGFR